MGDKVLNNALGSDQPNHHTLAYNGEMMDFMFTQELYDVVGRCKFINSHYMWGHQSLNGSIVWTRTKQGTEQVALSHDADNTALGIGNR